VLGISIAYYTGTKADRIIRPVDRIEYGNQVHARANARNDLLKITIISFTQKGQSP